MTGYNLNTPAWLWEAYKATVPKSRTLDEPLHDHMAERVLNHHADPKVQAKARELLGAGASDQPDTVSEPTTTERPR